jgi:acyl-CoA thioesterase FadM
MEPAPRLEVTHVSADFRHVPARRDAEVVVRCSLDGLGTTGVRTSETIETVGGALVVSAAATVVAAGEDGAPRPLTDAERAALAR